MIITVALIYLTGDIVLGLFSFCPSWRKVSNKIIENDRK